MDEQQKLDAERRRYPAGCAALSSQGRGRQYPASNDPYRTDYQRDRDRIIHSTAFRRLQHKTQVFANLGLENKHGDHYRTRLTHTIEVAQVSRTIARSLGLNEDLSVAVALAHDLGHTPFGHAGEEVLGRLMADYGGFNHNQQSLRVVDFLEKRYPGHYGLNLTYELREAIIKHETDHELNIPEEFHPEEKPLLEGQLVNLADEIAYGGHDVDDGLSSGYLTLELLRESDFLGPIVREVESRLTEKTAEMLRYALVRNLVNRDILDLVAEIRRRLAENGIENTAAVRACPEPLVAFSDRQLEFNAQLKSFLQTHMYHHPDLGRMKRESEEILSFLFTHYMETVEVIPEGFRRRFPDLPRHQLVADYIAGMTDRFAQNEFARLC